MKITNSDTRNPSPPPLTEAERESMTGDLIGSTIFSKRWVLDTLLKLYKHEEGIIYTAIATNNKNEEDEQSPEHTTTTAPSTDQVECNNSDKERSLERGFENDLCQLWDMTANTEVAHFLNEHDIKSVLRDALKRTQSPRLMEICFGILGNMMCVKEIRVSYTAVENMGCGEFRGDLLSYLTVMDALSLVELTRLLCTCLSCPSCSSLWIRDLLANTNHVGQLTYLLKNTLNVDLLSHVVKIMNILFDEMNIEQFQGDFVTDDLVTGLIEAYDQFHDNGTKSEYFVSLIHLLQLVVTESNKGAELVTRGNSEAIFKFFRKYFKLLDGDEGRSELQVFERLTIYASILSLLVTVTSELKESVVEFMIKNIDFVEQCLNYLRNIVERGHSGISVYLSICMEALSPLLKQLFAYNNLSSDDEESILKALQKRIDDFLKSVRQSRLHEQLNELCDTIENCKKF